MSIAFTLRIQIFHSKTALLRDPHNSTLLHVAATQSLEAVKKLFDMGADLRQSNVFGFTPFHSAMLAGQTEVALFLAKHAPSVIGKPSLGWQLYQGVQHPARPYQLWECLKPVRARSQIPKLGLSSVVVHAHSIGVFYAPTLPPYTLS